MGSGSGLRLPQSQFQLPGAVPQRIRARAAPAGQHHCPPCPPRCRSRPPCCGDRFRTCARAATARELSFREKNCRRPHEIWARRSGHFSMPATALHRSESYLSRPVAPFNAAGSGTVRPHDTNPRAARRLAHASGSLVSALVPKSSV